MQDRPPIPDPIKREVRQRCGFGCVICGLPLYDYEHMTPYEEVRRHEAENLTLLCDAHHREKTNRLLPIEDVRAANDAPANLQAGASTPYLLRYSGDAFEVRLGRFSFEYATYTGPAVALLVDDTPLIALVKQAGTILLTLQLFDEQNHLLALIDENELAYSVEPWDVEFVGQRLTVRAARRDIAAVFRFEPPGRLVVERAKLWRNGVLVEVSPERVRVGGIEFGSCSTVDVPIGLSLGDLPDHITGVIGFGFGVPPDARSKAPWHRNVGEPAIRLVKA